MKTFNEGYGHGGPQASTTDGLHAVRKPPPKSWKRPAAPPTVYRVEPRGFRQLVQRLTGAPPAARRLHDAAPAPLALPREYRATSQPAAECLPQSAGKGFPTPYSPYQSMFNLPLLSPGSIAFLDQTTVI